MYKNSTIKRIRLAMHSLSCIKIIARGEKPSKCVCMCVTDMYYSVKTEVADVS